MTGVDGDGVQDPMQVDPQGDQSNRDPQPSGGGATREVGGSDDDFRSKIAELGGVDKVLAWLQQQRRQEMFGGDGDMQRIDIFGASSSSAAARFAAKPPMFGTSYTDELGKTVPVDLEHWKDAMRVHLSLHKIAPHTVGLSCVSFITGNPSRSLMSSLDGDRLYHSADKGLNPYTLDDIYDTLCKAGFGKYNSDMQRTHAVLAFRLKADPATGKFDLAKWANEWSSLVRSREAAMDDVTAIALAVHALPQALRELVSINPATNKPWSVLGEFLDYVVTRGVIWQRDFNARAVPHGTKDKGVGKRAKNADKFAAAGKSLGTKAGGVSKHSSKASFVAGRSVEEINAFKKSGKCFKCGGTGHKAQDCKSK